MRALRSARRYFAGCFDRALGIGYREDELGAARYDGVVVRRTRLGYVVEDRALAAGSPRALLERLGFAGVAHVSIIAAPGLIARRTSVASPGLNDVIPGATVETTQLDSIPQPGGALAFMLRRERVDRIATALEEAGLQLAGVSLGVAGVTGVLRALDSSDPVPLGRWIGFPDTGEVREPTPGEPADTAASLTVDGADGEAVELPTQLLAPLAGAIRATRGREGPGPSPRAETLRSSVSARRILGAGIVSAVVLVAGGLGSDAVLSSRAAELRAEAFLTEREAERAAERSTLVRDYREASRRLGLLPATRTGFHADRIASVIPGGVALERLVVNPELPRRRSGTALETSTAFATGIMEVEGRCPSVGLYGELIRRIDSLPWVRRIEHLDFAEHIRAREVSFRLRLEFDQS